MNEHAQALGKLAKGKPKQITLEERKRRSERLAAARLKRWPHKAPDAEAVLTRCEWLGGVHYIFVSVNRELLGKECAELCEKYFETHKQITLPGEALWVDLRPAFRTPLASVTPKFLSVGKDYTLPKTLADI